MFNRTYLNWASPGLVQTALGAGKAFVRHEAVCADYAIQVGAIDAAVNVFA
jgi:hypothetical protein